jgi:ABC-type nitrate/sulfonate/bicarbonate transport system substrate-binding protein
VFTVQTRRQFMRTAAVAVGGSAIWLAGCGDDEEAPTTSAASENKPATINYGSGFAVGTVLAYSDQLMAEHAKKHNLTINVDFYEPNVIRTVLASGRTDFINFSPLTALALQNFGTDTRVIAHSQPLSDYVIVVNSEKITTIKDLEGTKFGSSGPGTISSLIPRVAVEAQGVDWNKLEEVLIQGSTARLSALIAGRIDATALYNDAAFAANLQNQKLTLLVDTSDTVPQIFASIQATPKFLEANRDAVVRMLMARAEAMNSILDDPEAFVAGYMKTNPKADREAVVKANEKYIQKLMWDPDLRMLNDVIETTAKMGVEQADPPLAPKVLPLEEWVDASYRDEAIKRLGGDGWWK